MHRGGDRSGIDDGREFETRQPTYMGERMPATKRSQELLGQKQAVVSNPQLAAFRGQLESDVKRRHWDELVGRVRAERPGIVRLGHVMWILLVIEGQADASRVPDLEPQPWRLSHDPGAVAFAKHIDLRSRGDLMAAFGQLAKAAHEGSPWCQVAYGVALVRGDVPAFEPSASGYEWIERGIAGSNGGCGLAELGFLLLDGRCVPPDIERGRQLIEEALMRPGANPATAVDYAQRLNDGLIGTPDPDAAHACMMRFAPKWRRWLERVGISQRRWVRSLIAQMRDYREKMNHATPAQLHQAEMALIRHLRSQGEPRC